MIVDPIDWSSCPGFFDGDELPEAIEALHRSILKGRGCDCYPSLQYDPSDNTIGTVHSDYCAIRNEDWYREYRLRKTARWN